MKLLCITARRLTPPTHLTTSTENEVKLVLAKQSGVDLDFLEAKDEGSVWDENGNVKVTVGSGPSSWFEELDEDLDEEWKGLGANETDTTLSENGQIVSKDALKGIRVGSAGGWSLEVFPGDFVVHRKYGIGRFDKTCVSPKTKLTPEEREGQKLRRVEIMRDELARRGESPSDVTKADMVKMQAKFGTDDDKDPISNPKTTVLEISYADGIVHVPVDRAYRLSRYRAGDSPIKPKLSKVRGEQWRNAKKKVEATTLQLAEDVLALYATRETLQRQPFDPMMEPRVKQFEATFPYEPTLDQKNCFEDVENDMVWRSRPMDRLVCGDVGFGKTEVALRAILRCVANGRQAAFLAPTGVLAAQHFKNTIKRMGPGTEFNHPISLLRGGMGRNTKAGRLAREDIEAGNADVIVGTHALLSNDIKFKDLGLLVIDEEQRFGVKQKERLKLICSGIDVLTMSATPIPRTLQMSLSGIRDTSTIKTPPPMRKPTKTFVGEMSDDMIYKAISTELARGGQCYYVCPRISMLDEAEEKIAELFPGITVVQAHGRMGRNVAEENVAAFAEGNFQVLLATTVIENGVDIPTVNTIVIQNAQNFGMSTLYQLRGRVGRSDVQAYAYFLHREESVTERAAMRLQAIGELNELGSGFDVANRDLEIRGAGSLLGTEQSGMAAKVGFDLYMRMLKKSIRQLRGLDLPLVPRTNIILPKSEGSIEIATASGGISRAFQISEEYIPNAEERQKHETSARLAESTVKLVSITNAWKKEYGNLPPKLQANLKRMHLHACTRRLGIDLVGLQDNGEGRMDCVLRSPGLRPRHWAQICAMLPKELPTKGLDAVFPARFTLSGEEEEITGGQKLDLQGLLEDTSLEDDAEDWDALDQEEEEAMSEISSALSVKTLDDVDLEQYPRFVIKNFGNVTEGQRVDALLKLLLPSAKVVYETQEKDKDAARMAAELRDKRENLKMSRKTQAIEESNRLGYEEYRPQGY
jgi:superfamily II DNA or RNA helicase